MQSTIISLATTLFLSALLAADASWSAQISLVPVSDRSAQDISLDGTFETLFPEADTFLTASVESPPNPPLLGHKGEHRTAMEFDISSIPTGTLITEATLRLPRISAGNSPLGSTTVTDVHGYVGNGTVEIADVSINNLVVSIGSGLEGSVLPHLQGLVDNGDGFAGFAVRAGLGYFQEWSSSEFGGGGFGPELKLTLIPEPSTLTLATFTLFGLLAYGWRGRRALLLAEIKFPVIWVIPPRPGISVG